jgi:hypothetical protein
LNKHQRRFASFVTNALPAIPCALRCENFLAALKFERYRRRFRIASISTTNRWTPPLDFICHAAIAIKVLPPPVGNHKLRLTLPARVVMLPKLNLLASAVWPNAQVVIAAWAKANENRRN